MILLSILLLIHPIPCTAASSSTISNSASVTTPLSLLRRDRTRIWNDYVKEEEDNEEYLQQQQVLLRQQRKKRTITTVPSSSWKKQQEQEEEQNQRRMFFSTTTTGTKSETIAAVLASRPLFGYIPRTQVTDYGLIDLDQKEIESDLNQYRIKLMNGFFNDKEIEKANQVYMMGAHALPYAQLQIIIKQSTIMLQQQPIAKGSTVVGTSQAGQTIYGTLLNDIPPLTTIATNSKDGTVVANVQYTITYSVIDQSWGHQCVTQSTTDPPITSGCFQANGTITIADSITLDYQYNITGIGGNRNYLSLSSFSINAKDEMWLCNNNGYNNEHCPYLDYEQFFDYYRKYDYANEFIMKSMTSLVPITEYDNGNANFNAYSELGKVEVFRIGTVLLNLWMYVVRMMEYSLDQCAKYCDDGAATTTSQQQQQQLATSNCDDFQHIVEPWDAAVLLYHGSLVQQSDSSSNSGESNDGYLLYKYANQECHYFNTCSTNNNDADENSNNNNNNNKEVAQVNRDIMQQFILGQDQLLSGSCSAARINKENIVNLMKVPLVQGTIRYAYYNTGLLGDTTPTATMSTKSTDHKSIDKAIGSVYAASIIPYIHTCSHNDAMIIYENMKVYTEDTQFTQINFNHVKEALERNYECLGITCEQVGGLFDTLNNKYYFEAEPCILNPSSSSSSSNSSNSSDGGNIPLQTTTTLPHNTQSGSSTTTTSTNKTSTPSSNGQTVGGVGGDSTSSTTTPKDSTTTTITDAYGDMFLDGTILPNTDAPTDSFDWVYNKEVNRDDENNNEKPYSMTTTTSTSSSSGNNKNNNFNDNGDYKGPGSVKIKPGLAIGIGIALFFVAVSIVIVCSCSWDGNNNNSSRRWGGGAGGGANPTSVAMNENGEAITMAVVS